MRKQFLLFLALAPALIFAQQTRKALFLGNSYTAVNNLPQITASIALSTGDTLIYDSNTPGGYTLEGHSANTVSLGKIMLGTWDYVVLQEQSQLPSFPETQVENDVYPYARLLDSLVKTHNPCAQTVFYMTWGRKNGDASNCAAWPPVCTYAGMDSLLRLRYVTMANDNQAGLSPAGAVWRYIRAHYPALELYQADESHPSAAGSYAAACCFYTVLFRKDPTAVTYNFGLSPADAASIRAAVKTVVFDSLPYWNIGPFDPQAGFTHTLDGMEAGFTNESAFSGAFAWDFGDGNFSDETNPVHTYAAPGTYTVQLISGCAHADTSTQTIVVGPAALPGTAELSSRLLVLPNPSNGLYFDLFLPVVTGNVQVNITDMQGREQLSRQLPATAGRLETRMNCRLSTGLYLLTVRDGNRVYTRKLVVK